MAELISAIAQLLWPVIALAAILVFRHAINRVLRTAERRELEFEVGGQRLTLHELNDQQNEMIQDLQRQLSAMSKQLEQREGGQRAQAGPELPAEVPEPVAPEEEELEPESIRFGPVREPFGSEPFAVLWVDDQPGNIALLVEQLRNNGVRVTLVASTAEALAEVSERPYRLVVSDMARTEDGQYRADAGLTLMRELRDLGVDIPVVVFAAQRDRLRYGGQARQAGAVATTSSSYELVRNFQNFGLL